MAFAPSLAFICAGMGLKALGYNLLSGTTEALTYDSLKTAGRERNYIKVDAKASIFMKLASALGALASLLAGVLTSAGYYLADAAVSAVSPWPRQPDRTCRHRTNSRPREAHLTRIARPAACAHFGQSRLPVQQHTGAAHYHGRRRHLAAVLPDLDVRPAAADPAGLGHEMAVSAGSAGWDRGHGGRIARPPPAPQTAARALFRCALLVATGTLLAGAAPALLCAAGPVLVQGALSVWFLHSMQRLNDAIPSDRRATLISVDSMAYSLLMIPASPLVGLVGDLTGQAAQLCVLCALVVVSALAAAHKTRYNDRGA